MLVFQTVMRKVENGAQLKRDENREKERYTYVDITKLGFTFGSADFIKGDLEGLEDKAARIVFGATKGSFRPILICEGELVKWAILLYAGEKINDEGVYRVDIKKLREAYEKVSLGSKVRDFEKWIKVIETAKPDWMES